MINPAKPEIKAARPRTYTTLWDTIRVGKKNDALKHEKIIFELLTSARSTTGVRKGTCNWRETWTRFIVTG